MSTTTKQEIHPLAQALTTAGTLHNQLMGIWINNKEQTLTAAQEMYLLQLTNQLNEQVAALFVEPSPPQESA